MYRKDWFVSLLVLVTLVLCACQPVRPPEQLAALKPGDKVGDMVVSKGPDPFDLNIPRMSPFAMAIRCLRPIRRWQSLASIRLSARCRCCRSL